MAAIDITPRHHFVQPRQLRRRHAYHFGLHLCVPPELNPASPDEMAFGQLRASNLVVISNSYAGSSSRILTDPTGERRNRQFRQCFRGLRSCRPNPSGESGLKPSRGPMVPEQLRGIVTAAPSWRQVGYPDRMTSLSYRGHRFPAAIIQHAIWLYLWTVPA